MLSAARSGPRIIPIDGSWYMPNSPRNPLAEFEKLRLQDARLFDLDSVKDPASPYPHMLPSLGDFNKAMGKLGIEKDDRLLVYDRVGNFSAPRVAWTLQTFGHDNVYLLDNFPRYQACAYPLERFNQTSAPETQYESSDFDSNAVLSFDQFVDIVSQRSRGQGYTVLDARSSGRFSGQEPEPRVGLSSGHAPGALNLPFSQVLTQENTFLRKDELVKIFEGLGLDAEKPTVVMCGTGVTACILKAALDKAGFNKGGVQVYDGSWTEYAQRAGPELIVKG